MPLPMPLSMKDLLAKARARVVRHLVLDKGALALTIGMGGLILLLLIGTQVLDWWWPVLLGAVSLGVGIYQLRKHVPSLYQLAQRIDTRLALADSLSTAVYFSEHPKPGLERVCALQMASAERLASGVNLEHALPFPRSRYLFPALGLLLIASGLFVTRYFVLGSMELDSSLLAVAVDRFFTSPVENDPEQQAKLNLRPRGFDPTQQNQVNEDAPVVVPPDEQKGTPFNEEKQGSAGQGSDQGQPQDQKQKDGDEGGEDSSEGDSQQNQQNQDKDSEREGQDKGQQSAQGEDRRSILDKLRDAVDNLMNKMGDNQGDQKQGKNGNKQKGQKQDKTGDAKEQSEQAEGEGEPDENQQGDQSKAQDAKQANAPGQKPSQQAASGAGENDGKKDIEEAKAEQAMGKVSELLAERSAEIKGQVMVEVTSTKQTLRTAMTEQSAGHTDAGGAIHRDQVPLADQLYVERYFQEIRKAGTAPTTPANGKGK